MDTCDIPIASKSAIGHGAGQSCNLDNKNELIDYQSRRQNSVQEYTGQPKSDEVSDCKSENSSTNLSGHDCEISALISVTIKKEQQQKQFLNRHTPRSQKYKVDTPSHDEICCLKEGYKLGKKIGEGAYSKVKAAEILPDKTISDPKVGRLVKKNGHRMVAVKILNKEKAPADYTTKFIGREIQALHRIRGHPNVVEIYDVFETSDFLFIITELCQKGDLCQFINAHTEAGHCGLAESKARNLFMQICRGMHYCHERGVVHRDFKCENVLICDDENTVKISDFGFACTVPNKRLMLSTPCGSYSYAAPEVLFGKSYDPFLADVWSLGVVLFCMLNGTTPYGHVQLSMVEDYMKTQRLQFQKISKESKFLIKELLQYDPRRRPRIQEIFKSPWVNKQKVNIVERLYTPIVPDRSHLMEMVSKFKVPTTPNHSTEHRLCINFSRISFGNGTESISLKSRQPHRERDRYFQARPILKRTRISVIEFKERMGLKIDQSQPIAQILKNIISGAKTRGGRGDELHEQTKIPALPGNLSTLQGESDQHMIEYLAEMWADIDRDRGTTVTQSTEYYNKPKTAPAVINTDKELSDHQSNTHEKVSNNKTEDSYEGEEDYQQDKCDVLTLEENKTEQTQEEEGEECDENEIEYTNEAEIISNSEVVGHPPPGASCCCCCQQQLDDRDDGTELSFCTCSNPETLVTGSTYTVHLPQPQNDVPDSPSPPPSEKLTYYVDQNENTVADLKSFSSTPEENWTPSTPQTNWAEMANLYKGDNNFTVAERARAVNDKAERVLARARVKNGTSPYDSNLYKHVEPSKKYSDGRRCKQLIDSVKAERAAKAKRKNESKLKNKSNRTSKLPGESKMIKSMNKTKATAMKLAIVKNLTKQEGGSGRRQALALVSSQRIPIHHNGNRVYLIPPSTAPPAVRNYICEIANRTMYVQHDEIPNQRVNRRDIKITNQTNILDVCAEHKFKEKMLDEKVQSNIKEEKIKYVEDENKFNEGNNKVHEDMMVDEEKLNTAENVPQLTSNENDMVKSVIRRPDEELNKIMVHETDVSKDTTVKQQFLLEEEPQEMIQETCIRNTKESHMETRANLNAKPEDRPSSVDLKKQNSGLSVDSVDEELLKVAEIVEAEEPNSPTFTPMDSPPMLPEVKHLVSPVRLESKSVSPMIQDHLSHLKPRRTESDKSPVPSLRDHLIYQRHARATPVKDKYLSDEINAEIKKTRKLTQRRGAKTSVGNEIASQSLTSTFYKKSPRRAKHKAAHITTTVQRLVNNSDNLDRDNKSLPLLQVHKSYVTRPVSFQQQTEKRGVLKKEGCSKPKKPKQRTRSPFPNPMSNPNLWHHNPESLQHRDDARSTPSIACPLLPQKLYYTKEFSSRNYRNRALTPDQFEVYQNAYCMYNGKEEDVLPEKVTNLFPPVMNLTFEKQDPYTRSRTVLGTVRKQY